MSDAVRPRAVRPFQQGAGQDIWPLVTLSTRPRSEVVQVPGLGFFRQAAACKKNRWTASGRTLWSHLVTVDDNQQAVNLPQQQH